MSHFQATALCARVFEVRDTFSLFRITISLNFCVNACVNHWTCACELLNVNPPGFQCNFPVSKLRHGSGENLCQALDFLLQNTLKHKRFKVLPPVYTMAATSEEAHVDQQEEMDDEIDEGLK